MKEKVKDANQKLITTVWKYFSKKGEAEALEARRAGVKAIGVQACIGVFIDEKKMMEDKKKDERLKQLTDAMFFEKLKSQNLQKCLREKAVAYEQKLQKIKNDKSK